MNRSQIAVVLTLHELGVQRYVNTFTDRLIAQKAVYLAQEAGVDLGYFYGWYLHGPYCSSLTDDLFAAHADPKGRERALARCELDKTLRDKLRGLQCLMRVDEADLARRLELLASVHFLIVRKQVPNHAPKTIAERLKKFKKEFNEDQVRDAIAQIRKAGMLLES